MKKKKLPRRKASLYIEPDVIAELTILAAREKAEAAKAGRPMRSADGVSDIVNAALKAEITKRKKKRK